MRDRLGFAGARAKPQGQKAALSYSEIGPVWAHAIIATCTRAGIMPRMTLVEITYELQSPLNEEQLRTLGAFANTYGLRRFRVDDSKKNLSFEYDASRLRETEVAHVLRQARIPVMRKVN